VNGSIPISTRPHPTNPLMTVLKSFIATLAITVSVYADYKIVSPDEQVRASFSLTEITPEATRSISVIPPSSNRLL